MSSVTHPRGQLPARTYWIRRGVLLLLALVLIFGISKMFGGSDPKPQAQATIASQKTTPTAKPTVQAATTPKGNAKAAQKKAVLAQPSGTCNPSDVTVRPVLEKAHAGFANTIKLTFTGTQPACNFQVNSTSVAVRIVSGTDRIWSTQECSKVLPTQDIVVRSAAMTVVPITWSGRRTDSGCGPDQQWAKPGYYHAMAAVIGSSPSDVQFQLGIAPRATVTKTAKPKPTAKKTR